VLPGDVALQKCAAPSAKLHLTDSSSLVRPSHGELEAAAGILNAARRVVILGGAGCEGAHEPLIAVAARLKAPIVHAMRGKEHIEYDNPYDVGMTGLLGFSSGYHAMMSCDALLMLGTDFPYQQFYPERAKIIQVDVRGEQIGRHTSVDLGLVGKVKDTVEALLPLLSDKSDRGYLDVCLGHYAQARKTLDELATGEPGRTPIHPQYVARLVDELAAEDAIFTCDVGTPTVWAARYLRMNGKRRLLGSFTHGSMANALPQAIGAQGAFPGKQVVSLSGDGGLAMLLGDLLTLRQLTLPVKVVVFNNSSLGFVELEMKAAGLIDYATDLVNPDFAKLAESAGILGIQIKNPEDLRPALSSALAHEGPALVEVIVNRQELAMPPTISADQVLGFSLYMIRAVLNGRGDEVVDLAKTNLFR
jgi:pyruvate dehydrogenase (quinone)